MSKGVKVRRKEAERLRKELLVLKVLDKEKKVKKEGDFIIFPVKGQLKKLGDGVEIVTAKFEKREKQKKFEDYLFEFLSGEEIQAVRTSFDVIGDIAIIEIPEELERYEKKIAQCLANAQKNIKTVFKKSGRVKGEERVRELKFLYGEKKTETMHKEHGCRFNLDISKVYFSPRLSHERERILTQTKDGETIVDLFAGIGPFCILLAKYRDVKVYAIDKNTSAIDYLRENIRLNKVEGRVTALLGDCRKIAPKNIASRVIMNLPKSSGEFLDLAFDVIKKGVIHFYTLSEEKDLYNSKIEFIKKMAEKKGRKVEILNKRVVRPYSPYHYHVVIDVDVKK
jgi:tRNA (guanine37-N1)-methyltransferase